MMKYEWREQVYDFLFGGEEGRACETIPDEACREVPGNALKNVASGACSKLAEQLAHPGLTIPWLLSSLGVPPSIVALLLPLKDAGSLGPQLFIASAVRNQPRRKMLWALSAAVQAVLLVLMAGALWVLPPLSAGVTVAILFLLFGVSSGLGSLSFKDTLAKTIPKPRRGTLLGLRASIGGAVALLVGILLAVLGGADADPRAFLLLVVGAALFWLIAGALFLAINEYPGATEGGRNPFQSIKQAVFLIRGERNIQRFILTRSFNLSIALLQPLYVVITADRLGYSFSGLGTLLIASAGAALLSGYIWGRATDRSSRRVLAYAPFLGVSVGVLFFLVPLAPSPLTGAIAHGVLIFFHNVAYSGARLGRKTYLVNAAGDENRALVAAGANTSIGIATLALSALVSVITGVVGAPSAAWFLLVVLTLGGLFAFSLEEV